MTAPGTPATPERIVDIAIGYMGAKQLFAAARTGLFRALADGERDVAQLASETGLSEQMTRILADAMNGLGLLERTDGRYRLAPDAAAHLSGAGDLDLHPFLAFLNEISYGHWLQFDTTVDTTEPGELKMDEGRWKSFMAGVMRYNSLHAAMLARSFDFGPYRDLLDLGGLSPEFAIGALRANPELSARFVFDPASSESIAEALAAAGLTDRAVIDAAPTDTADPGGEHDLVMVNHVIHRFDAEQNRAILTRARAAARPGATLLLLDFLLDDDERQRPIDALHAGEYFVIDGTVVYPESEVTAWLEASGWRRREVLALPGSPRVVVAEAV
ncbi:MULTISPECIES: methyltransferase dimerization domain-containing protein [unclassified Streptomyces]|uniref:methyltransferase n=1 Tax=unclassified Streptomyces TaxID=2593676 RepID=UPI00136F5D78|nr:MULTISPECIES: methyltransferase dimerization domain-containing protein [unclassified Streptomyces]MCW5252560.1 polyketide biosynthesis methyltransferase [Streptomyces sp. SHP 1-2]MYU26433.1 polyketide biosynthesis methyltransferase [Streptomyces sp. SID8352]